MSYFTLILCSLTRVVGYRKYSMDKNGVINELLILLFNTGRYSIVGIRNK